MSKQVLSSTYANIRNIFAQLASSASLPTIGLTHITRPAPKILNLVMFPNLNPLPQLPKYRGQYNVGSTEFEIPVSEIDSTSPVPDPKITTIKFRLFYPTTESAKAKKSIPWLPTPQNKWNQAYARFLGVSESRARWISYLPSVLNHATIPAVQNAPLLQSSYSKLYPTIFFSHGLGGNCNTYSSFVGSLASCGIVCVVPEHRDGSAPISFVKSSRDKIGLEVPYQKLSHSPNVEVLNARNAMLRIRLWELELLYTTIYQMNQGKTFTNYADTVSESSPSPPLKDSLDLNPGQVTWAGHSFGAATITQFVKSVYYHQSAPQRTVEAADPSGWNWTPLYSPARNSNLVKQITPKSPVGLLDVWTMPLRGEPTRWLWEKPLPCYDRASSSVTPNVIAIMSAEFYKWSEMLNRTKALLSNHPVNTEIKLQRLQEQADKQKTTPSADTPSPTLSTDISSRLPSSKAPVPAETTIDEPTSPELTLEHMEAASSGGSSRTPSPARSDSSPPPSSAQSASSSQSSLPSTLDKSAPTTAAPHLYLVPNSAHLSQSDFGLLFPNVTRYFMKALDPEKTMELNVRALLAVMRGAGLQVADPDIINLKKEDGKEWIDRILEEGGLAGEKGGERWQRINLA